MEHADPVGEVEHHVHVVLDQDDRQLPLARDLPDDPNGGRRVVGGESLRGLVEQQQLRLLGDGHRDLQQPLIAVRQGRGRLVGPVEEAEELEAGARAPLAGVEDGAAADQTEVAPSLELHSHPRVLEHGQLGKDAGDLEGARDAAPAARGGGERGDVVAAEEHAAHGRRQEPRDQVEQRGLAGTVRADDRAQLTGLDREADAVDGLQGAEGASEPVRLEHRRRHTREPSRRAVPTSPPGRKITIRTNTTPVKIIQCSV